MISQRTIEEIKERANLIDIAGESVQLKRSGSNYSGLCPFHSEDSPSFHVRDGGKYYHCFGCGASGNVISFVMESRGLSFPDAVEEIAARYGIAVIRDSVSKNTSNDGSQLKEQLLALNQVAADFFKAQLTSADKIIHDYVKSRQLTSEAIKQFGIGFAPATWGALTQYLQKHKFTEELILLSGLVRRSPKGELFDAFRGRLIFPVWIESRKVAGFGGRIIPALLSAEQGKNTPKYINSPETLVYKKNQILYGLPHALEAMRRSKEAYLVEGYVDVIGLWQAGVKNALAPCGTAVSENHIRRLKHLVERVTVLFDGDDAGRNAAARCFGLFINSGISVAAVFLPENQDPDTIAVQYGSQTQEYLTSLAKTPLVDCFIENSITRLGWKDAKEMGSAARGKLAQEVMTIIKKVENLVEQSELVQRAAMKLLVEPEVLAQMLNSLSSKEIPRSEVASDQAVDAVIVDVAVLPALDRELLCAVMANKDRFTTEVLRDSNLCEFLHPCTLSFISELNDILQLAEQSDSQRKEQIRQLLAKFGDSWLKLWKRAYSMLKEKDANFESSINQCRSFAKKSKLKQILGDTVGRIREAQTDEEKAILAQERLILNKEIERL